MKLSPCSTGAHSPGATLDKAMCTAKVPQVVAEVCTVHGGSTQEGGPQYKTPVQCFGDNAGTGFSRAAW